MIPYGRQEITQEDIDAVVEVLSSDFLTQGPVVPKFEDVVSNYCGSKYAVAVNSATSALHLACLALQLGPGDWLWTSPNSFAASSNCGLYCGAKVDFIDIDPKTYNISVECLSNKLEKAKKENKLPKIVMPVHLSGQSCEMEPIYKLSKQYGFKIIEDASHAIGGRYKEKPIGSCEYSDITVFSFHPVKIITSGEGGMALTNNPVLLKRLQLLRSHGISTAEEDNHSRPAEQIWNYQQIDLGYNYRMTDIHAALGISQMQRLDKFVTKRHLIAKEYNRILTNLPLIIPHQLEESYSSYHLYVITLKLDEINKTQKDVYKQLHDLGIKVNLHYIPIYRMPYYEQLGFREGYCPIAEKYHSEALSIPMFPGLNESDLDKISSALSSVLT